MIIPTIVYFERIDILADGNFYYFFRTIGNSKVSTLLVASFDDGIAIIDPPPFCDIEDFAKVVAGCFDEKSNFGSEVMDAFMSDDDMSFNGIQFDFDDIFISVTEENASVDEICKQYYDKRAVKVDQYLCNVEKRHSFSKDLEYAIQQRRNAALKKAIDAGVVSADMVFDGNESD